MINSLNDFKVSDNDNTERTTKQKIWDAIKPFVFGGIILVLLTILMMTFLRVVKRQ